MDFRIPQVEEYFPSTLEHRPLHIPEKMALKAYFEVTGADEGEGYVPSVYAIHPELVLLESWIWGMRFWGRECLVRGTAGVTQILVAAWEAGLATSDGDEVSIALAYDQILSPAEAISIAHYWAHIPSEEKANRILEKHKLLPEAWFEEPLHAQLQGKPFFWGALAGVTLVPSIFVIRDEAATMMARVCCGAARVRMLAGRSPADAAADVRATMILTLRKWMGYRW
jgi:hypothetical protein